MRRKLSGTRTWIDGGRRKRRRERRRIHAAAQELVDDRQVGLVIEQAVPAAHHRAAAAAGVVGKPETRREIVLIHRVAARRQKRVELVVQRDDLEVVAQTGIEREVATLVLVLREPDDHVRLHVGRFRRRHQNAQALGVGPRVRRVERRIRVEGESAVHVRLIVDHGIGKDVLHAEFHVVVAAPEFRREPVERLVELIRVVDALIGVRRLLIAEGQHLQRRHALCLRRALEEFPRGKDVVFVGVGKARGHRRVVAQDRVPRADRRPIDVGLLALGRQRPAAGNLIEGGRGLLQVADAPGVARVQLIVESHHPVPHPRLLRNRVVQLRPCGEGVAAAIVDGHALEASEEVRAVADHRTSDRPTPLLFVRVGFGEVDCAVKKSFAVSAELV